MPTLHGTGTTPPPSVEPIPPAARIAALVCAALAATGLLGWLLHVPSLRRIVPGLPEMQPNTAIALLWAGLSLLAPDRAPIGARAFALVPLLLGGATVVEYATGADLGIDNALLTGTLRMAPESGLALTCLGLALLARRSPAHGALVGPLIALPTLLAYLALVGFLFGAEVPYYPLATTMALQTATATLAVALGLVLSRPRGGLVAQWRSAGPGGRTTRALLPVVVVLPPVLTWLRTVGEHARIYDEGFGLALQATAWTALIGAGVLAHARTLDAVEEARSRGVERFRQIVANIPEGVCVTDPSGRVLYANARLAALLGGELATGADLVERIDTPVQACFRDFLRHAVTVPARLTVAVRTPDRTLRFLRFSGTPAPDPVTRSGDTLLVVLDDTSRRIAEDRLRARAHELEKATRDLDAFAGLASHDLREPLRKIQLLAERAMGEQAPEGSEAHDALTRIQRSAALLQHRVRDLLAYSRLGAEVHIVADLDLGALVPEVEARLHEALAHAGATVTVGALPRVLGDPLLLGELLLQLFENAIKFRRPEVPLVIRVGGRTEGEWVELTVADNGMGFDDAYRERIFEMLRTLHPRDRHGGTGIGLATCRRIVELHGGTITAKGMPGKGSVFTIRLPMRSPSGVPAECVPIEGP